ncbi:MAG: iron-containing alcohol dehydrogenase [Sphingomonas sp.]|nr:iron-containing alcohol dehydrogenase [Sphingomonas sp.]
MTDHQSMFGALRLPRSILFGRGQRRALGSATSRIGKRALLCTDAWQGAQPIFKEIVADLEAHGVETRVFDQTIPDLPINSINACVEQVSDFAPEVVIGIGGGSSMDMAKVVAVLLTHGGDVRTYYGEFAVPGPVIPDALTHAVEAFTTLARPSDPLLTEQHVFVGKNVLSDHFAKLAVANIFRFLERAYSDGSDIEAREGIMLAALAAGCAFGTAGTAAAHALQYPVGNLTHTAHGDGVATLLPFVMQYNRPSCVGAFAELARAVGLAEGTPDDMSQAFIDAVADLLAKVNIPLSLAALGLKAEQQDFVAENALNAARLVKNNPRFLDLSAMQSITRAAFSGDRSALRAL